MSRHKIDTELLLSFDNPALGSDFPELARQVRELEDTTATYHDLLLSLSYQSWAEGDLQTDIRIRQTLGLPITDERELAILANRAAPLEERYGFITGEPKLPPTAYGLGE